MIKLRYSSGNIISPDVHKIGMLALGSHLENHGAALPMNTDSKIAAMLHCKHLYGPGPHF